MLDFAGALGEEIGWRGFLAPALFQVTNHNFTATVLINAVIWACWTRERASDPDWHHWNAVLWLVTRSRRSSLAVRAPAWRSPAAFGNRVSRFRDESRLGTPRFVLQAESVGSSFCRIGREKHSPELRLRLTKYRAVACASVLRTPRTRLAVLARALRSAFSLPAIEWRTLTLCLPPLFPLRVRSILTTHGLIRLSKPNKKTSCWNTLKCRTLQRRSQYSL
jgi:hypothetical protein